MRACEVSGNSEYMNWIHADHLYTQALAGKRIREHDVVYIFDDVGCGKTVSAIIAMAAVISEKKSNHIDEWKILVLTPKSVCSQFTSEINKVLKIEGEETKKYVEDISDLSENKLRNAIGKIEDKAIVISNPQKVDKLKNIKWDLIVIDEAHEIVCDNLEQEELYYKRDIDDKFNRYIGPQIEDKDLENGAIRVREEAELHKDYEKNYKLWFLKFVEFIDKNRAYKTTLFKDMFQLASNKVMYLTATPYKNRMDIDSFSYAFLASAIIKHSLFRKEEGWKAYCLIVPYIYDYLPDLKWIKEFYALDGRDDFLDLMEQSNTSYMFKEIAQAIPYEVLASHRQIDPKSRNVEVWNELSIKPESRNSEGSEESGRSLLRDKLMELLKDNKNNNKDGSGNRPNRVVIFVSSCAEGEYIFKKIFPNPDPKSDFATEHCYVDEDTQIKCEFIMRKFYNTDKLRNYANENDDIPDILIVTWQVAQVGINLPTFNYVINYNIPKNAAFLEQRFGRIDRLVSKNNPLYNIYYLDRNPQAYLYPINLICALSDYSMKILDPNQNLPVKNLLICKNLEIPKLDEKDYYSYLANYIYYFLLDNKNSIKEIEGALSKTEWNGCKIDVGDRILIVKLEGTEALSKYEIDSKYNYKNDESFDDYGNIIEKKKATDIEKIEELCQWIKEIQERNNKINTINSEKLNSAGAIIFWNENKKAVVVDCKEMIERIIKSRWGLS